MVTSLCNAACCVAPCMLTCVCMCNQHGVITQTPTNGTLLLRAASEPTDAAAYGVCQLRYLRNDYVSSYCVQLLQCLCGYTICLRVQLQLLSRAAIVLCVQAILGSLGSPHLHGMFTKLVPFKWFPQVRHPVTQVDAGVSLRGVNMWLHPICSCGMRVTP